MAKGSNPVDAHRKLQRKQELKKNKQKRETTREISTVKTDTRPIEAEIRRLTQESQKGPLSKTDKDELSRLRADLARLNKAKQEYVDKHPEHRKFVFPERAGDPSDAALPSDEPAGLYDRNGRLKHPERSLYFDPVFNPYGAPPPGMPYREKPEYAAMRFAGPPMAAGGPSRAEIEAFVPVGEESSDDDGDDDDDIAMPAGPPPTGAAPQADDGGAASSDSSDSDDSMDIPLPPGPPPPRPGSEPAKTTSRPTISRPSASSFFPPPQHTPHALPSRPAFAAAPPPPPPQHPRGAAPPAHPHAQQRLPARPPPAAAHMSDPLGAPGAAPHRAFQQGRAPSSIGPVQPDASSPSLGAPPPAAPPAAPSPFLSLPGAGSGAAASSGAAAGATISAAPVLRDLKKEATAFVPAAMRRKMAQHKATLARAGLTSVDAARGAGAGEGGGEGEGAGEKKKSLVEEMRERGIGVGAGAGGAEAARRKPDQGKEDYERFRAEMGDLL
ncbi:hypothetical protein JCM8208_004129 [Rhodotorula glutinis]